MIRRIRESFITKVIALGIMPTIVIPIFPTVFANGGPTDSNYNGASGMSELVDVSSGKLNYSIPLLDVGGYPITLSYNPDVTMDQQASMVGLGWDISTGAINRIVRGVPDDFDGDLMTTTMNLRPRLTITNIFKVGAEAVGFDLDNIPGDDNGTAGLELSLGFSFNNYSGNENILGLSGSFGITQDVSQAGPGAFFGAGLSSSSRSGLSSNLGVSLALGKEGQFSTSLGINRNSLYGNSLDFGFGYTATTSLTKRKGKNKDKSSTKKYGANLGGSFPLGMQSYTPTATFEFQNKTWTFDLAAGGTVIAGLDIHGSGTRTKSTVCLKENVVSQPAYGYLNQEKGYAEDALQDFNLNLPQVHENVAGINTPVLTNDYFAVTTSGATFRALRSDAGYVKDPKTKSDGNSNALSGDVAFGAGFEAGINYTYSWNNLVTGNWNDNPFAAGSFVFQSNSTASDPIVMGRYEKFTFLEVNNTNSVSPARYDALQGETPFRQEIYKASGEIQAYDHMTDDNATTPHFIPSSNGYIQNERRQRSTVYEYLNNHELRLSGDDTFGDYTLNNFTYSNGNYTSVSNKSRSSADYPGAHIGEFTAIYPGGSREVYGIPVMNESDQVSFNISEINSGGLSAPVVGSDGLVTYNPTSDNTLNNTRGDNNFYMKNHVPKHATAYLLTQVLSDNYVDRTGNGLTPDDYGDYTRFNYAYEGSKKWRFPYQTNKASFNEGFKSDVLDDMASYSYGSRDEWYIHSIETKDYIAEFQYDNRQDAHPVAGENGGIGSGSAKRLVEIRLYTRKGKEYGKGPIKTVHFVYDYSLCPNSPDSNAPGGGKLTLKELYFTKYDSPQGKLYRYSFEYSSYNASYNLGKLDRWGNYQDAPGINYAIGSPLDNAEYPYTKQDKALVDTYVQNWKLKAVNLPSGGRIEIDYEANDYEYIQDFEATRMYKIDGFYTSDQPPGIDPPDPGDFSADLFDPDEEDHLYFYVLVNLDGTISGSASAAESIFENQYLPQTNGSPKRFLYYNTLLNLAPHNDGIFDPDVYEYIQGYCEIVENGWELLETSPGSNLWNKAIIRVQPEKINPVKAGSPKVHPISRKAWQVIKEALPLVLYPEDNLQAIYAKDGSINCDGVDLEDGGTEPDMSDDSKNHKKNMKSVKSVYHMMKNTGYASRAVLAKCWVRMRPGQKSKVGGGYRVKEVRMHDNWDQFVAGENNSVYGTRYEYTTTNNLGETISSGVASYEPIGSGGDEIALRNPHYYVHSQKGIPSEKFYTEFPLNEQIYATTDIKYSRVKTSSIEYPGLTANTTGYTIHEHYTAQEFPVEVMYTGGYQSKPQTELKKPGALGILGISKRRFGISYGISVVTNDMHGKFKSKKVYSAEGTEVYKMEHHYHKNGSGKLENLMPTIHKDGSKTDRLMGKTVDVITHINKSESNYSTAGVNTNFEFTPPFIFVPSVWPTGSTIESSIYSTLTTKVIYQTGLIQEIMVEDNGRHKSSKNLLYDAQTKATLVTKVAPEQGPGQQFIYDYDYPAHWMYDGMDLASISSGTRNTNITGTGTTILAGKKPFYYPGDELMIFVQQSSFPYALTSALENHWVVENESNGDYFLADADGNVFTPNPANTYVFKIQNPGRCNRPHASVSNITSLDMYAGTSPYISGYNHTKVINVNAQKLYENAKLGTNSCVSVGSTINPYLHNLKGIWKVERAYAFDGDRSYVTNDSRKDGLLSFVQPFWQNQSGQWLPIDDPARTDYLASKPLQNWVEAAKSNLHDAFGGNLEAENVVEVPNSISNGYYGNRQTSHTANSRFVESGFDGFEDYFVAGIYDNGSSIYSSFGCGINHFGLGSSQSLSEEEAHTGRYSLHIIGKGTSVNGSVWNGIAPPNAVHTSPFQVAASDLIGSYRLINDQPKNMYVLTFWVKEAQPNDLISFETMSAQIYINSNLIPATEKRSNIIDGWQRVELTFEVATSEPNNAPVEILLSASGEDGGYFDDIRLQPYDSEMESYVIDPINQRLMAKLDGRNFATIYQYDESGNLIRLIQETDRGKQTIQENRTGNKLNN